VTNETLSSLNVLTRNVDVLSLAVKILGRNLNFFVV